MTDPRARITAGELVVVLSRYDLGAIASVSRFRGGSRQAPKVLIDSERGRFLLKRRAVPPGAAGAGHSERVAFSHAVAEHLAGQGFPMAGLVRDRAGLTAASVGDAGRVYELFRFIEGERYDHRPESAREAGRLLAAFHTMLAAWPGSLPAPAGTFHNRPQFAERLRAAREQIEDARARPVVRALGDLYQQASERAEALGVSRGVEQIIHGDWHPGNMIFHPLGRRMNQSSCIAAVLDLDSARVGPLIVDVANGALQFGALRKFASPDDSRAHAATDGGPDPHTWRIALDPGVFAAFCAGYRGAGAGVLGVADSALAVPWLMVEALIVEAVLPIAATGTFGRLDPLPLLALVERTASSIVSEQDRLVALATGT